MTAARRRMIVTDIREHFNVSQWVRFPGTGLAPFQPPVHARRAGRASGAGPADRGVGGHPPAVRLPADLGPPGPRGLVGQQEGRAADLAPVGAEAGRAAGHAQAPPPAWAGRERVSAGALKNKLPVSVLQYPYLSDGLSQGCTCLCHTRMSCRICTDASARLAGSTLTAPLLRCTVPSTGSLPPPTSAAVPPRGIPRPATRAWRHRPGGPHHRLQLPYRPSRTTRVATGHRDSPGTDPPPCSRAKAG